MIRLLLLMATYVISEVYKFFPNYSQADICDYKNPENGYGFLFSTMVLSPEAYVFAFCQHIIEVVAALVILISWHEYRLALWTFFALSIADTVDFSLTYSSPWFDGPPTFNHLKMGIFGLSVVLCKVWKTS